MEIVLLFESQIEIFWGLISVSEELKWKTRVFNKGANLHIFAEKQLEPRYLLLQKRIFHTCFRFN